MAQVTFRDSPISTNGNLSAISRVTPDFILVAANLSGRSLADFAGRRKVLNIFPSINTGVCAQFVRTFNERASSLENTVALCTSADLPFVQARFCDTEGLESVVTLSAFHSSFSNGYGVTLTESPLRGLTARAVVVLDEQNQVLHTESVSEIASEPDYEAALAAL